MMPNTNGAETTISACHHVFFTHQVGVANQPLRDELGVFDEVGAVTHHAWDERCPRGHLEFLEYIPLMFMAWISRFNGKARRIDLKEDIHKFFETQIKFVRAMEAAGYKPATWGPVSPRSSRQ